jgi:hypothetical protein
MRRTLRAAMLMAALMVAGAGTMKAQIIDPSTGIMVDASTDPMDFSLVASGQPGNFGTEASSQAFAQMQQITDSTNAAMAQAEQPNNNSDDDTPVVVTPSTPKPKMSPNGGKFAGSVQVALTDTDPNAVLHFTTNGEKANGASPIYSGPITVTAKEKVSAMAVDPADRASGVVSKTFKPKS